MNITPSGRAIALERPLPGHAQHVTDRLPRTTRFSCRRNGTVKLGFSGLQLNIRHRDGDEDRIADAAYRIGALPVVRGLDLIQQLFISSHHHHLSSKILGPCLHGVKYLSLTIYGDLKQFAVRRRAYNHLVAVLKVNEQCVAHGVPDVVFANTVLPRARLNLHYGNSSYQLLPGQAFDATSKVTP